MAVYKLFPTKDATIYSYYPNMNTGIDPIIELGNLNPLTNPSPQVSRFLIQFNQTEIESIIDNKVGTGNKFSSSLKCFIAEAQGVNKETTVEAYAVYGSWENGTGQYLDSPQTTDGVTWRNRVSSGSSNNEWITASFPTYVTASYTTNNYGGGNWYTGSDDTNNTDLVVSQSLEYRTFKDLNLNVTDIVNVWYSSSNSIGGFTNISNEGFLLKLTSSIEFDADFNTQPQLQYYSIDTNTIYPPVLEIKWDDSSFETGSLSEINTTDLVVALDNNPGIFYSESINRFRLNVREQFPVRTFQTGSIYTTNKFLNSSSLYAIKDLDTNEFIIDFDSQFTKISCDSTGNYFDIYMNGLEPERYYKILIQTTISGSTIVKDDRYYFKVVNG
jgi:hypothetical protein